MGNEAWVHALPWKHKTAFQNSKYQDWTAGSRVAGSYKQMGPLTFLRVADAGHMVPMDQPAHALHMITSFAENTHIFKDQRQPLQAQDVDRSNDKKKVHTPEEHTKHHKHRHSQIPNRRTAFRIGN